MSETCAVHAACTQSSTRLATATARAENCAANQEAQHGELGGPKPFLVAFKFLSSLNPDVILDFEFCLQVILVCLRVEW